MMRQSPQLRGGKGVISGKRPRPGKRLYPVMISDYATFQAFSILSSLNPLERRSVGLILLDPPHSMSELMQVQ